MEYKKASLTSDIVICFLNEKNRNIEILLAQRKNEPFINKFAIPGGFVDLNNNETFIDAAVRELKEETGLNVSKESLNFFKVCDKPNRDPRGRVVSSVFYMITRESYIKEKIKAGDDAINAQWFDIEKLPSLAFDHEEILKELINHIFFLRR